MKSFTDIEQSCGLAEFLSYESADMLFQLGEYKYADSIRVPLTKKHWEQMMPDINPCWSLAALLNALPKGTDIVKEEADTENEHYMCTVVINGDIMFTFGDNSVDACVDMILKLKRGKL